MKHLLSQTWFRLAGSAAAVVLAVGWWLASPLFLDQTVDEAFPLSAQAEIPDDLSRAEVEEEMESAIEEPVVLDDEPMPETEASVTGAPAEPVALLSGEFIGADDFHAGRGTATVYELEDGGRVLRFEDFEVTNGPDLHVLLVPHEAPTGREDLDGYVDLGSLKGNIGNQNYEIPEDIDVELYGSIVIYCEPFHVLFATAGISG